MKFFDRRQLRTFPLAERKNKLNIEQIVLTPQSPAPALPDRAAAQVKKLAERIIKARKADKPVIMTFGAHLIKNGLAPMVIHLLEKGWLTHLAANGAVSIHDWEFAYLGQSSEDVRENTAQGKFGIWEETGRFINLALAAGGLEDLGYGWSVGKMIAEEGLQLPASAELKKELAAMIKQAAPEEKIGALADLLYLMTNFDLPSGKTDIPHPFKKFSVQEAAYHRQIPFTVHPGLGYDIIHTHPLNCGGIIGRAAMRDFLSYAASVSRLEGGVHLAVGSAIMAPMIFEKSLSMANNLAIQRSGKPLQDYYLAVVDIQEGGDWDWRAGEPPETNPAYYLRFCKSFYRMGGTLDYLCLDNRAFMLNLCKALTSCDKDIN